ncbi:MAG: hypothetical protein LBK47_08025 [Prevotellaceae bacterium]|jgi:hypothetical protein|nr:hypothetical protein [Prevotellaceae bacterium]
MKKKRKLTAVQKEWIARVALALLLVGLPLVVQAQGYSTGTEDSTFKAIRDKIVNGFTTILMTVAAAVALIYPGYYLVMYAMASGEDRGKEHMDKLKSGIGRVLIGCGGAFAAGAIGKAVMALFVAG